MKWGELLAEIKRTLKEPEFRDGHWRASELLARANEVQRDICRQTLCIRKRDILEFNDETGKIPKPAKCLNIEEVLFLPSNSDERVRIEGRREKDLDNLERLGKIGRDWRNERGTPIVYVQDYVDLILYPNPYQPLPKPPKFNYAIYLSDKTDGVWNASVFSKENVLFFAGTGIVRYKAMTGQIVATAKTDGEFVHAAISDDFIMHFVESNDAIWAYDDASETFSQLTDTNYYRVIGLSRDGFLYFGSGNYGSEGIWKIEKETGNCVITEKADGLFTNGEQSANGLIYFAGIDCGIVYLDDEGIIRETNMTNGSFECCGSTDTATFFLKKDNGGLYMAGYDDPANVIHKSIEYLIDDGETRNPISYISKASVYLNKNIFIFATEGVFYYKSETDTAELIESGIERYNNFAQAYGLVAFFLQNGIWKFGNYIQPIMPQNPKLEMTYYSLAADLENEDDSIFDGISFLQNAGQTIVDGVVYRCLLEDGNAIYQEYDKRFQLGLGEIKKLFREPDTLETRKLMRRKRSYL